MRELALFGLIASCLFAEATAIRLIERATPAVVRLDIQRRYVADPLARDRLRRRQTDNTVTLIIDNERNLYFANGSVGTPAQDLRFHLDTGSSDMWTNSASSLLCSSGGGLCEESGTYDANASSTYEYVNSIFNVSYADGSSAIGDYVRDTFRIGGIEFGQFQFGVGYDSTAPESILGIGYPINEIQVRRGYGSPYPNLPQRMVENGIIQSNAYSIWLNDLDAATGSILFGGVNTEKYVGNLQSLPMQKFSAEAPPAEFVITLTGVGVLESGRETTIASDKAYPVLLDTGSSLTYLPDELALDIFRGVNAEYDSLTGSAVVACALADTDANFQFTFSSPVISVPMNELVIRSFSGRANLGFTLSDGVSPACLFGIRPAGASRAVLGDTFLRSAYVVYDLENHEISIAQTNFNSTTDRIVEIGTGRESVPDAEAVANPVPAQAPNPSGARIGGPLYPTRTYVNANPSPTEEGGSATLRSMSFRVLSGVIAAVVTLQLWI